MKIKILPDGLTIIPETEFEKELLKQNFKEPTASLNQSGELTIHNGKAKPTLIPEKIIIKRRSQNIESEYNTRPQNVTPPLQPTPSPKRGPGPKGTYVKSSQ